MGCCSRNGADSVSLVLDIENVTPALFQSNGTGVSALATKEERAGRVIHVPAQAIHYKFSVASRLWTLKGFRFKLCSTFADSSASQEDDIPL